MPVLLYQYRFRHHCCCRFLLPAMNRFSGTYLVLPFCGHFTALHHRQAHTYSLPPNTIPTYLCLPPHLPNLDRHGTFLLPWCLPTRSHHHPFSSYPTILFHTGTHFRDFLPPQKKIPLCGTTASMELLPATTCPMFYTLTCPNHHTCCYRHFTPTFLFTPPAHLPAILFPFNSPTFCDFGATPPPATVLPRYHYSHARTTACRRVL